MLTFISVLSLVKAIESINYFLMPNSILSNSILPNKTIAISSAYWRRIRGWTFEKYLNCYRVNFPIERGCSCI